MRSLRTLALVTLLGGCASAARGPALPTVDPSALRPALSFADWEGTWLAELGATDPRLAARLPVPPSKEVRERLAGAAVLRGDQGVGVFEGGIDLFSYETRARALRELGDALVQAPSEGKERDDATRDERSLLTKLIEEETLRAQLERESPDLASERVRAIVAVWGHPASPREVDERDELVQRGLERVVLYAAHGQITGARSTELEDSLDPLERLATPEGYPRAAALLTRLRVELGKAHAPEARPDSAGNGLAVALKVHLGVGAEERQIFACLEREELTLRQNAASALQKLDASRASEALHGAGAHIDEELHASSRAVSSRLRSMRPPPERALVAEVLRLASEATTPLADAVASLVLHDDLAVALWALAIGRGATDLDATRAAHPLLATVPPGAQDRLVRTALVSPARVVAPGLAAVLLAGPAGERAARAGQWLAFGDAPLDSVARCSRRQGVRARSRLAFAASHSGREGPKSWSLLPGGGMREHW